MKQDIKPLWQRLNEERTQTEWSVTGLEFRAQNSLLLGSIYKHNANNQPYEESEANAQYTALAVNNLASLAEAITTQMEDVSSKDFYELMQSYRLSPENDQEAVIKAFIAVKNFITRRTKEALNKIS